MLTHDPRMRGGRLPWVRGVEQILSGTSALRTVRGADPLTWRHWMEQPQLNWNVDFVRGSADDVLRDFGVHGKCRDLILPMTVLRCLDALTRARQAGGARHKARARRGGNRTEDRRRGGRYLVGYLTPWRCRPNSAT